MKILVTGAKGFIGQNLVAAIKRQDDAELLEFDLGHPETVLDEGLAQADVIFHLAGVNRPENPEDYAAGNAGFTQRICERLALLGRKPAIIFSSSIQAALDNPYGVSKRRAEEALLKYAGQSGAPVSIFRMKNVFGKWCRPDYNSVVATFCHRIARDLPITISDPEQNIDLVYIDDAIEAMIGEVQSPKPEKPYLGVEPSYRITLGGLAGTLRGFRAGRESLVLPDMSDPFIHKLYATYISYLPKDAFDYALTQRADARGELAELLKSPSIGQIFVSRTRPGITRGHHYHDTKIEKFVVLEGDAAIRFRDVRHENAVSGLEPEAQNPAAAAQGSELLEYRVSGKEFRVVDIPPGYTHAIENVGKSDLIVLFWANQVFDPEKPDTFAEIV